MKPPMLRIEAASRLHFGLLSFGHENVRQYGGVGVMVASPGLQLEASAADRFEASGPGADRVVEFAQRWAAYYELPTPPACHLCITRLAPQHVGLGTGTQLGLSVATLLGRLTGRDVPAPAELAASVARGRRSAVGTYGFYHGGLIYERGKRPEEAIGELASRVALPESWRVLQICPLDRAGLSGESERKAFGQLPAVPRDVTQRLRKWVEEDLLPAARQGDLDAFGEAVYQYGVQAGCCFAAEQGGVFVSSQLADWSAALRRRGILGVGQSSWGPTLFAFLPDVETASETVAWFRRDLETLHRVQLSVSRIAARGALESFDSSGAWS